VDSSGVRFWYTSNRRPETASVVNVGLAVDILHFVPAGISRAMNSGYCARECTQGIPEQGAKIISTNLHAHTIGAALRLRQIRNGVELPPVEYNQHYDFNFQQTVAHFDPILVLPGDEFIMDCWYDSTSRTKTTYGGLSTREEMCMVFMYVYPKIDLSSCGTDFSQEQILAWRQGAIEKGYLPATSNLVDDYDVSVPGALEYYEELWTSKNYSKRFHYCVSNEMELIYGEEKEIVQVTQEYVEPNPCEHDSNKNGNHGWLQEKWLGLQVGAWLGMLLAVLGTAALCAVGVKYFRNKHPSLPKSQGYLSIEVEKASETKVSV
jgi:hypothetical protein